ncbi:hypothetical protein JZ785_14750 [Alicyclobacillus curvatus]|jgi:hypothetical protein|nr:hypothetical protein JZ785_14750 [Alicyclobacillus curvatus]
MNDAVVFQPEWNGRPKRQFRHLDTFAAEEAKQMKADMDASSATQSGTPPTMLGRSVRSFATGECICLECGHEFGVQREGAMYLCERCTAKTER